MLRVVLIDDEKEILTGMQHLISWNELDFKIIASFQDGRTAMNYILKEKPDLVITDIKMPEFTGLDLIKAVKEKQLLSKYIILSGYDSFEFAKKAIEYGVSNYLLKPVDEDELVETLNKIKTQILSEDKTKSAHSIKNGLFSKLIQDISFDLDLVEKTVYQSINQKNLFQVVVIKSKDNNYEMSEFSNLLSLFNEAYHIINGNNLICIIVNDKIENHITAESTPTLRNNSMYSAAFSRTFNELSEVHSWVTAIMNILETNVFFNGYGQMIKLNNKQISICSTSEIDTSFKNQIKECIIRISLKDTLGVFDRLNDYIKENSLSLTITTVRTLYFSIMMLIKDLLINNLHFQKEEVLPITLIMPKINDVPCYHELDARCRDALCQTFNRVINNSASSASDLIKYIECYIELNYRENITLKNTAEKYFINPSYLSYLFTKKTGQSFWSFVTNTRLAMVRNSLINTNKSINEIALETGFNSIKTLYKAFKAKYNKSPNDFRKSLNKA